MRGTKEDVEIWLMLSHALFSALMPEELLPVLSGMQPAEHAAMVDRQTSKVNEALLAVALSAGEPEVRQIFGSLDKETVIALCSRWAHYHKEWTEISSEPEPRLWIPPGQKDLWRTIFLAMTDDREAASAAGTSLWPEYCGGPHD